MICVKRVYDPPEARDGTRFLVDRLRPRGLRKDTLRVDRWFKGVSPSNGLRHWFGHDRDRWGEFQRRYSAELDCEPATWQPLFQAAQTGVIALVFGARDAEHNNAIVVMAYLTKRISARAPRKTRKAVAA